MMHLFGSIIIVEFCDWFDYSDIIGWLCLYFPDSMVQLALEVTTVHAPRGAGHGGLGMYGCLLFRSKRSSNKEWCGIAEQWYARHAEEGMVPSVDGVAVLRLSV